ncbi:MAG: zinc ribbon domain-containing protein [Apilactobacillus sp.]|uniref:Zinc ribbon domain-containing protein n=2 Tax=Apilactobacillus nanyangensis TaxID=2799579 RepID=A0ABT0HWI9_9LACO|nr:zinc ribbon domain-containing protein [Apilactobacillus nanyangensis]MCT6858580.1 zinc ribbon domain-containing protein [Apilactobacillus sp.]TMS99923.1 zinc ribbon domain-containing protein [Apilactobacillus kunkeei]MCK8611084.1 zinc ribbon domain-containing protein [Apilactobacillus nanyangensis]TMT03273.1 zinc ribbon domain-containing protein [Apilactobacillus kunkeei]CAI2606311.1 hypothetical protein AKUA1404_00470 [Apilactobacillus kunkeei]
MAMKFCPNCGDKLENIKKFCPNCGESLTMEDTSTVVESNQEEPIHNVNYNAPVPAKIGFGNDFKTDRVIAYKRAMGIEPTADNVVVAEAANMGRMLISTAYAAITDKWFILSFEEDGVLFMGINKLSRFTGQNIFIPKESISEMGYKNSVLRKVFSFKTDGRKNKYYLSPFLLNCDFQKKNMEKLDSFIAQY